MQANGYRHTGRNQYNYVFGFHFIVHFNNHILQLTRRKALYHNGVIVLVIYR